MEINGVYEGTAKLEGGGTTVFYVDPRDGNWVRLYSWWCNKFGYIYRQTSERIDGGRRSINIFLHREVAGVARGDGLEVDHLNFDRLDCRRANLCIKTRRENRQRQQSAQSGHINEGPPVIRERFILDAAP